MRKSTNAEISKRVLEIYSMLVQGFSYNEILRYTTEKYKISPRQIDIYIKSATKMILKENEKTQENLRAEATLRYQKWLRKLESEGKIRDAILCQSRLDKINGLEIQRIDITGNINATINELNNFFLNKSENNK